VRACVRAFIHSTGCALLLACVTLSAFVCSFLLGGCRAVLRCAPLAGVNTVSSGW